MRERQRAVRSDIVTDVEQPWIDALERMDLIELRDVFLDAGVSPSTAAGLVMWLADQRGRRRLTSESGSKRYRHVLRDIAIPG